MCGTPHSDGGMFDQCQPENDDTPTLIVDELLCSACRFPIHPNEARATCGAIVTHRPASRCAELLRTALEAAEIDRDETQKIINVSRRTIEEQADKIERLTNHVNDLQAGCYINCVYCGHRYGPNPGTPVAMADVLKEHIAVCPKHPLSAANAKIERLEGRLTELGEDRDELWRQVQDWQSKAYDPASDEETDDD